MAVEPRWLTLDEVLGIQVHQVARFGGLAGVKDMGLVESAVTSPRNLWHYEGVEDLVTLAARYAVAIPRNHGFNDGNKRTGWAGLLVFLELNGYAFEWPDEITPALWVESCVEKKTSEAEFIEFLAAHIIELDVQK